LSKKNNETQKTPLGQAFLKNPGFFEPVIKWFYSTKYN